MRRMLSLLLCLPLLLCLLLVSCMVGPNFRRPTVCLPEEWDQEVAGVDEERRQEIEWWKRFDDPTLDWLVQCALEKNWDLAAAKARVREARALRRIACGALLPTVDGAAGGLRHRISENALLGGVPADLRDLLISNFDVGFDASWEIDLFGKLRRDLEAASADVCAALDDGVDVLVSLLGEVARNYVEMRGFQKRIRVAERNIELLRDVANIAEVRYEAGLANSIDYLDANALAWRADAVIPKFRESVNASMYRLAVLLGMEAGALVDCLATEDPIPQVPDDIPIATPCDLVSRRPDVRRAEWDLKAQNARIGAAIGRLYPTVDISALVSFNSVKPANLINWSSRMWEVVGGIVQPIFEGGRLRAEVRFEWARYCALFANYQQTVLLATEEVRNALTRLEEERIRCFDLGEALNSSSESRKLSLELYTRGLVNFLFVLNAERAVTEIDDALVETEAEYTQAAVSLYKALGGCWTL